MPGTAVASRKRARQRIMRHYSGHRKDAAKRSQRFARRIENEKARAQRTANSKKK